MKKNSKSSRDWHPDLGKFFKVMKLCTCIMLCTILSVSANTLAQRVRMSIERQNADMISVLSEVCKKNGFQLLYNDE